MAVMTIRYVFKLPVAKVEHRKHIGRITREGIEQDVTYDWIVVLDRVGFAFEQEPEFQVGDIVRLTIERDGS